MLDVRLLPIAHPGDIFILRCTHAFLRQIHLPLLVSCHACPFVRVFKCRNLRLRCDMPNYAFTNCLNRIRITPKRTSYLNTYNLNQTVLTFFLISSILPHQVSRYNRRHSQIQIDYFFALPAWFLVRTVSPRLSNSIGLPALLLCIKKTLQKRKTASKYTHGDPTKKRNERTTTLATHPVRIHSERNGTSCYIF